jgi:hypothetical protein
MQTQQHTGENTKYIYYVIMIQATIRKYLFLKKISNDNNPSLKFAYESIKQSINFNSVARPKPQESSPSKMNNLPTQDGAIDTQISDNASAPLEYVENMIMKNGAIYKGKQLIQEISETDKEMGKAHKCGLMEPNMRDPGKIIKLMVKGNSITSMAIYMKAIGSMTNQVDSGYTIIQMEENTLGNGKMINRMDSEKNRGQMAQNMLGIIEMAKSMAKELILGAMATPTMGSGLTISFRG